MKKQMSIWTSLVAVLCMATISTAQDRGDRGDGGGDRDPAALAERCIGHTNRIVRAIDRTCTRCVRHIRRLVETGHVRSAHRVARLCARRIERLERHALTVSRRCFNALEGHPELRERVMAAAGRVEAVAERARQKIQNALPDGQPSDHPSDRGLRDRGGDRGGRDG